MNAIPISIGVEDLPAELVLRRLLRGNRRMFVRGVRGLRGNGYLLAQLPVWNRAASALPMIVVLDLDKGCAAEKRRGVLADAHPNMLLRIAVFEIESWLIADSKGMSKWSGIPLNKLPHDADALDDPKRELVNMIRRHGRAALRRLMLPGEGDRRLTAPGYNDALRQFIEGDWNPDRATTHSSSFARARARLAEWRPRIDPWLRPG